MGYGGQTGHGASLLQKLSMMSGSTKNPWSAVWLIY
jgi:hypothetical protein